jgi:hypothetical protein
MRILTLVLSVTLLVSAMTYFIFDRATLVSLGAEDGLVENLSAINWLFACLVMLFLFFRTENIWYFLLAMFFLVCLGEEISWGQRFLNFRVPELVRDHNIQEEFNLHNLELLDRRYGEGGFWKVMFSLGRLFAIFWFTYCCLLPVLVRLSSKIHLIVEKIRLPIVPIRIGVFFLLNNLVYKYYEVLHPSVAAYFDIAGNPTGLPLLNEARECYASFLFLVFSLFEVLRVLRGQSERASLQACKSKST